MLATPERSEPRRPLITALPSTLVRPAFLTGATASVPELARVSRVVESSNSRPPPSSWLNEVRKTIGHSGHQFPGDARGQGRDVAGMRRIFSW